MMRSRRAAMMPHGDMAHLLMPDYLTHEGWRGPLAPWSTEIVPALPVRTSRPLGSSGSASRLSTKKNPQT